MEKLAKMPINTTINADITAPSWKAKSDGTDISSGTLPPGNIPIRTSDVKG
jgi:hypothetical protein